MSINIPVIIVSGTLGSGKTTFVRSLVRSNPKVRFGVVVNEFGEIGVDGDLLSPFVPDIVEIRNGCICCATQDQLLPAIREITTKYAVDVLLIEMSGAADSVPVAQQVGLLAPVVSLRAHLVVGDCTLTPEEATCDRSYCSALSRAGVIALSKSDIADEDKVAAWRLFTSQFNPSSLRVDIQKSEASLEILLAAPIAETHAAEASEHISHGYASVFRTMGDMTARELKLLTERLGSAIIRMKGILRVDGRWSEVQQVRSRLAVQPYAGSPPEEGRLVFIGRKISKASLNELVDTSLAMPSEARTACPSPAQTGSSGAIPSRTAV